MQAVHMVKCGVPLGVASSSLLVKFIVYQGTLTLYSLVILLFITVPLPNKSTALDSLF